jgi:hypothetical protein
VGLAEWLEEGKETLRRSSAKACSGSHGGRLLLLGLLAAVAATAPSAIPRTRSRSAWVSKCRRSGSRWLAMEAMLRA